VTMARVFWVLLVLCIFAAAEPIPFQEFYTFVQTSEGVQLPAILTIPEQQHPNNIAAVFIHGSGPQDENETVIVPMSIPTQPYYRTFSPLFAATS